MTERDVSVCSKCPASLLCLNIAQANDASFGLSPESVASFLGCAHKDCDAWSIVFWDREEFLMRVSPGPTCKMLQDHEFVWDNCRSPSIGEWESYRSNRMDSILGIFKHTASPDDLSGIEPLDFTRAIFCEEHAQGYIKSLAQEEQRWRRYRKERRAERNRMLP